MPALGGGNGTVNGTTRGTVTTAKNLGTAPPAVGNAGGIGNWGRVNPTITAPAPVGPAKPVAPVKTASTGFTPPPNIGHNAGPNIGKPASAAELTAARTAAAAAPAAAPAAPAAAPGIDWAHADPSQTTYDDQVKAADPTFALQLASLKNAASTFNTDTASKKSAFDTNWGDSVRNLGWVSHDGDYTNDFNPDGSPIANAGDWNWDNLNSSAGAGKRSLADDYAARGMLHSSAWQTALNDFDNTLAKQLSSSALNRQTTRNDYDAQNAAFNQQTDAQVAAARNEAFQRLAQGLVSGVGGAPTGAK